MKTSVVTGSETDNQLKVFTLGRFLVKYGEKDFSEFRGRSQKLWDLFKYLLVHNDRVMLPEVIAEQLWPEQNFTNAKSTVRTHLHRLRGLLGQENNLIEFTQRGYILNRQGLWLDTIVFESSCHQARQAARQGQMKEAYTMYSQALALYKGELLPECAYSDWLVPIRKHYHHLYLQSVVEFVQLLRQTHSYAEIIQEVVRALLVDYFDEELHIYLLEALLKEGKIIQAKKHYENVTSIFYRELGIKPSLAMLNLFRQIQEQKHDNSDFQDFNSFREAMDKRYQTDGAFLCEQEFFRFLCQLEIHRAHRSGQNGLLLMLSVANNGNEGLSSAKTHHTAVLQDVLQRNLRNTDVFCKLNDHHYMVLLSATTPEQGQKILQRLTDSLKVSNLQLKSRSQLLNQSM